MVCKTAHEIIIKSHPHNRYRKKNLSAEGLLEIETVKL
jgi:hypothetical protein